MANAFAHLPGAVVDDAGLRHVGNPLIEQRRLHDGAAVAPLGDRAVIAVPGEDRLSWLDSLSSQALTRLEPGVSTELLVLDPQAAPERNVELRRESEEREDDPFDLPPEG